MSIRSDRPIPQNRIFHENRRFCKSGRELAFVGDRHWMKPTWHDPKTGLQWQAGSTAEMNWRDACEYARRLDLDGKRDWRLPTVKELESLLDRSCYRPIMRRDVPFRDERSYWSRTTFGPDKQSAWIVMFDGAYVLSYFKTNLYRVRCVRGRTRK